MSKIDHAIRDVQDAERDLTRELRRIGERHAAEQDLYHLSQTLARQSEELLELLGPFAERYDTIARTADSESAGILEAIRRKGAELLGRSEISGMLLLRDLRNLYIGAQEAEIAWVILAQVAQAIRDAELLRTVTSCREHAEVRGKWIRTRIKEAAPQVLVPN